MPPFAHLAPEEPLELGITGSHIVDSERNRGFLVRDHRKLRHFLCWRNDGFRQFVILRQQGLEGATWHPVALEIEQLPVEVAPFGRSSSLLLGPLAAYPREDHRRSATARATAATQSAITDATNANRAAMKAGTVERVAICCASPTVTRDWASFVYVRIPSSSLSTLTGTS